MDEEATEALASLWGQGQQQRQVLGQRNNSLPARPGARKPWLLYSTKMMQQGLGQHGVTSFKWPEVGACTAVHAHCIIMLRAILTNSSWLLRVAHAKASVQPRRVLWLHLGSHQQAVLLGIYISTSCCG